MMLCAIEVIVQLRRRVHVRACLKSMFEYSVGACSCQHGSERAEVMTAKLVYCVQFAFALLQGPSIEWATKCPPLLLGLTCAAHTCIDTL
jgi:hypothetical protein